MTFCYYSQALCSSFPRAAQAFTIEHTGEWEEECKSLWGDVPYCTCPLSEALVPRCWVCCWQQASAVRPFCVSCVQKATSLDGAHPFHGGLLQRWVEQEA